MYRFLLKPRWLGLAALTVLAALVMWLLGGWQLDRYREKTDRNGRIDAAAAATPVPVREILTAAHPPPAGARYTKTIAVGTYDPTREILVRGRTVASRVGFEVVTPLLLDDGTALLVSRGWVPPGKDSSTEPAVPPPPPGRVEVVGMVRLPQQGPSDRLDRPGTRLQTRAIHPARLATALPYPLLGGYVTTQQDGLTVIEPRYEGAVQNGGYALQWWIFALMAVIGFGYLVYREAHPPIPGNRWDDTQASADDLQATPVG